MAEMATCIKVKSVYAFIYERHVTAEQLLNNRC